jgi:hypothetical protein
MKAKGLGGAGLTNGMAKTNRLTLVSGTNSFKITHLVKRTEEIKGLVDVNWLF